MIAMLDTKIPEVNDEFKLERFDNEILLYSVIDTRAVYLNETAFLVYGMCGSGQTVGEIIVLLQQAYPDHKDSIREDVTAAINTLVENGALHLQD
jgi:hypothetical protein